MYNWSMTTRTAQTAAFAVSIDKLITHLDEQCSVYFTKHFPSLPIPQVTQEKGGLRYLKLQKDRSVYAFIEIATGDIFKPASWRAPAKHARGNLFDPASWACFGPFGVAYLTGPSTGRFPAPAPMVTTEVVAESVQVKFMRALGLD